MKPILRDLRNGLYFKGGADWTPHPEEALLYRDLDAAFEAACSSDIPSLELNVLLFDDPRYTLRLALNQFLLTRDYSTVGGTRQRNPHWFSKAPARASRHRLAKGSR